MLFYKGKNIDKQSKHNNTDMNLKIIRINFILIEEFITNQKTYFMSYFSKLGK
jgi:hypothetical protein